MDFSLKKFGGCFSQKMKLNGLNIQQNETRRPQATHFLGERSKFGMIPKPITNRPVLGGLENKIFWELRKVSKPKKTFRHPGLRRW